MKKLIILITVLAVAGGITYVSRLYGEPDDRPFVERETLSTGTIVQAVKAIGTLQPIEIVRVGAQVSGDIKALYADFNSIVKKDQVLAELDSSLLEAQVAVQEANIARQETDLAMQQVQLANEERNQERKKTEFAKGLISSQEVEKAVLAVKTRKAQITSAEKMKVQAEAQLAQAKLNVSYCTIRSPIDGVVISRMVDVGQTLQSRVTAPTLFTLAAEMTTLRLQAGVDEADIGRIRPNMPVTFTVDSYRGQTFRGRVAAVRLNAQISNSVVTYPVWIEVPNPDLKLRPSMTANLQIVVDSAENVLRVPADAIRFRLTNDMYAWLGIPAPPPGRASRIDAVEVEPSEPAAKPRAGEHVQIDELFAPVPKKITPAIVWVYDENAQDPGKRLRQVVIRTGVSDGSFAELVSGDLQPAMELVTAVYPPPSVLRARNTSPFGQPQRGFGGMTPGGPNPLPTLNRGGGGQRGR